MTINETITLSNGVRMPLLGLGVFQMKQGGEVLNAVRAALEAGYRHIDTAEGYRNEEEVGQALAESGVPRSEVWVTTKLSNDRQGYETTKAACEDSLRKLRLDQVDLYLMHWPFDETMADTWRAMQELRDEGKCRAIGVSNFSVKRFEFFFTLTDEAPAVNQVELHPFNYRPDLLELHRAKGIATEAYSPLTRAQRFDDPTLVALAEKHGKTPAQILIRWDLQHGIVTIPKSSHKERIIENADVYDFALEDEEVTQLDGLAQDYWAITWRPDPDGWY